VWADAGIISTGESYKNVVKLTFAKGGMDDYQSASLSPVAPEIGRPPFTERKQFLTEQSYRW